MQHNLGKSEGGGSWEEGYWSVEKGHLAGPKDQGDELSRGQRSAG